MGTSVHDVSWASAGAGRADTATKIATAILIHILLFLTDPEEATVVPPRYAIDGTLGEQSASHRDEKNFRERCT